MTRVFFKRACPNCHEKDWSIVKVGSLAIVSCRRCKMWAYWDEFLEWDKRKTKTLRMFSRNKESLYT